MSKVPADLKYTKTHEWLRTLPDGNIEIGITDHAQHALGDLVFVEVPETGRALKAGEPCGEIESTKSANDLVAPVSGTVRARHDELEDSPDLVNSDPYGEGWIFEVETDPATLDGQLAALMDADAYRAMVGA